MRYIPIYEERQRSPISNTEKKSDKGSNNDVVAT